MRYASCLLALLAAWTLVAATPPAWAQEEAAEEPRVLVLPFEVNAGPELDYLNQALPQLVRDALREKDIDVVGELESDRLLAEQGVDVLDVRTVRDLALLAGATHALYGSFSQAGEAISIDTRLVEAFGVEPVRQIYVVRDQLLELGPAMDELAEKVQVEIARKQVVSEIEIRGTEVLDDDVVRLRIVTQPGDVYDPAEIDQDLRRIWELGYFDDVQVYEEETADGRRLIFEVSEKPRVVSVEIVGNDELDTDDIEESMSVQSGDVLNMRLLSEDLNKIRQLYRQEGFYNAQVDHEITSSEEGFSSLVVKIEEGNELYIEEIVVEGAEKLDEDDVKDQLALSERGWLSWLTGSGVLQEEFLERDAAAIESFYANMGFIEASVLPPEVEYLEEGIRITYTVEEGPRYRVRDVTLRGDLIESPESLKERIEIDEMAQEQDFFDRSRLRDDVQRLTDYYSDFGYAFAETDVSIDRDEQDHFVDVELILDKGSKVYVRRVTIEGNTATRDNVIRRQLRLVDGDLFSGSKLKRSQVRLEKLDYFEKVDIETIPTEDEDELDLRVKVEEKPTGNLSAGVGYSSYDRFFVAADLKERNLFGRGYVLNIRGQIGGRETQYVVGFTNPNVWNTLLSAGADTYYVDDEWPDYKKRTIGGRIRFGYPVGEYSRLSWGYRLDNYEIYEVEEDADQSILDIEGNRWSSVINTSFTRDTTNLPFNPTRGMVNKLSMEWGGGVLGGDDDFLKLIGDSAYYKRLFWELVLGVHVRVGHIFETTEDPIPPFERFYLGGINTVRGYEHRHISPRSEDDNEDRIGGNKMFLTNFELVFPISKEYGVFGLGFFDMGNTWEEGDGYFTDNDGLDGRSLEIGLFKSFGGGIRWLSPLGPMRMEYGYPLDELEGEERSGRFEFSVGSSF